MPTKVTATMLASGAAQDNLNAGSSITLTKAVSISAGATNDFRVSSNSWTSQILVTDGGGVYWNFGTIASPSGMFSLASAGGINSADTKSRNFKMRSTLVDNILWAFQATGNISLGHSVDSGVKLHVQAAADQLRIGYDASNYLDFDIDATGGVTITPVGSAPKVTLGGNLIGNGSSNTLPNQAADSESSIMTRDLSTLESLLIGNEVRRLMFSNATSIGGGGNASITNGSGNVSITTTNGAYGAVAFGAYLHTHPSSSGAPMPTNKNYELFLHGMMFRFEANVNWTARLIFGKGAPISVPALTGVSAADSRCWGVEFYYDGSAFKGRLFWYDTSINYGTPFTIPVLSTTNWLQLVYSIRMRQTSTGLLEIYINSPSPNVGGPRLPTTPTSSVQATWTATSFAGRYFVAETVNAAGAATTAVCQMNWGETIAYFPNNF